MEIPIKSHYTFGSLRIKNCEISVSTEVYGSDDRNRENVATV